MTVANGHAGSGMETYGAVMDLGETTFESFPVKLDGRIHEMYITTNRRYPVTAATQLDKFRLEWEAQRELLDPADGPPPPNLMEAARVVVDDWGLRNAGRDGEDTHVSRDAMVQLVKAVEGLDTVPVYKPNPDAWEHFMNKVLTVLSNPPFTYDQANGITGPRRYDLLLRTGYLGAMEASPQGPPVPAPDSTGDPPRETSPMPTAE